MTDGRRYREGCRQADTVESPMIDRLKKLIAARQKPNPRLMTIIGQLDLITPTAASAARAAAS